MRRLTRATHPVCFAILDPSRNPAPPKRGPLDGDHAVRTSLSNWTDIEAVRSWIRHAVEWPGEMSVRCVRLNRLWPDKRGQLTFEFAVESHMRGETATHMIQAGPSDRIKSDTRSRRAALDSGWAMNLSLSNAELGVSLLSPDRDPRLSNGRAMLDRLALLDLLRDRRTSRFLKLNGGIAKPACQVVAHRIGKRCVVRLTNHASPKTPTAFLKVFRRMPPSEAVQTYRHLATYLDARSGRRIGLPLILDEIREKRVLVFAGVNQQANPLKRTPEDLCAAARGLAFLHDAPLTGSTFHMPENEIDILRRWLPIMANLDSAHEERLQELVERLSAAAVAITPGAYCLAHRDYYSAQVLRDGEKTWIVDLDTLCMGHPEVDIATYAAHILMDEMADGATDEEASAKMDSFVEKYRKHGGKMSSDRLRFYLSSAITRLATIHATRGLCRQRVIRMWCIAERHLCRQP